MFATMLSVRLIRIFLADLKELLAGRDFASLRTALRQISPFDLADGWEYFNEDERVVLFKLAPRQRALQLFEDLEPEFQEELLTALKDEEIEELVDDLDPTETGRIMRELPTPLARELEDILRKGKHGEKVEQYLKYPEDTVGEIMRSNYVVLSAQWTCRKALERIQMGTLLRIIETTFLDSVFVVEPDGTLLGIVTLKELVVAPPEMPVAELMNKDPEVMRPEMDQEVAAQAFAKYNLECAPVIDERRKLLGVVLDQDIVDVVEEETEEDLAKIMGTAPEEFDSKSAWESARHRFPWLTVTCVGQLMVAGVIWSFELALTEIVALATFIPLIAAMGGNVGAQSAIIVVREISTGGIKEGEEGSTVMRDLKVGVLLGLAASAAMVLVAHLFYGHRFGWRFAIATGVGVLMSMSVAATLGACVPLVFRRVGIDPATGTGPLVTTLTDIVGTAAYLGLASYLLMS
ncbi:magnesium transporter [Elusimicrobiota bacterium]